MAEDDQETDPIPAPFVDPLLKFFEFIPLPPELRIVGKLFFSLANELLKHTPHNAEQTAGIRKLLEARDCALRACQQDK